MVAARVELSDRRLRDRVRTPDDAALGEVSRFAGVPPDIVCHPAGDASSGVATISAAAVPVIRYGATVPEKVVWEDSSPPAGARGGFLTLTDQSGQGRAPRPRQQVGITVQAFAVDGVNRGLEKPVAAGTSESGRHGRRAWLTMPLAAFSVKP